MPSVSLSPVFNGWQGFTPSGIPLALGLLYSYQAGTNTPTLTYTTNSGITPNSNPIQLDSGGRPPQEIWLDDSIAYKFILTDSIGNVLGTYDNIVGNGASSSAILALLANLSDAAEGSGAIGFNPNLNYVAQTLGAAENDSEVQMIWFATTQVERAAIKAGTTTTDHTSLIQGAMSLLGATRLSFGSSGWVWNVSQTLTCVTGSVYRGRATINQKTANTAIFTGTAVTGVTIEDLNLHGLGTDFVDASPRNALGVVFTGSTRVKVLGCTMTNFSYAGVRFYNCTDAEASGNRITGIAGLNSTNLNCFGILFDGLLAGGLLSVGCLANTNIINQVCQGIITNEAQQLRAIGNRIYSTYQHGMYLGAGLVGATVIGNIVVSAGLVGIKCQAQDYAALDNTDIDINENIIISPGDTGILISSGTPGAATYKVRRFGVSDNKIYGSVGSGIFVSDWSDGVVSNNIIENSGTYGIFMDFGLTGAAPFGGLLVEGNFIRGTGKTAIRDGAAVPNVTIRDNDIRDCCTLATAGDRDGILSNAAGSTGWVIEGNVISDANAKMEYGIHLFAGALSTYVIVENTVANATGYGFYNEAGTPVRKYSGNIWTGTIGAGLGDSACINTVASAATVTLPQGSDTIAVSGTVNINNITAGGNFNRLVSLRFAGILTLSASAGNLRLASNFTTAADSMLHLRCTGSNWYEVGRVT